MTEEMKNILWEVQRTIWLARYQEDRAKCKTYLLEVKRLLEGLIGEEEG